MGECISGAATLTGGPPSALRLPILALLGTSYHFYAGRSRVERAPRGGNEELTVCFLGSPSKILGKKNDREVRKILERRFPLTHVYKPPLSSPYPPTPDTNENFRQGGRGVSFLIPEIQNSQALTPQQPLYTPLPFIPLPPNLQGTKK